MSKSTVIAKVDSNPVAEQDEAKAAAVHMQAALLSGEQLQMNQVLGRIQATNSIATMLEAFSFAQLKQIKEEKLYRRLKGQTILVNGEDIHLDTWDGFCMAVGTSRSTVDEQLQNLQLLGEQALNRATELGMTTRELRNLRALDVQDQKVVIGQIEAAVGDKDAIVDLITDMAAKHKKTEGKLEKQLKAAQAEAKATERIVADKEARIAELQDKLIVQESRSIDEQKEALLLDLNKAQINVLRFLPELEACLGRVNETDDHNVRLTAANILHELKETITSLQIEYGLAAVSNPDDDWMADAQAAINAGRAGQE